MIETQFDKPLEQDITLEELAEDLGLPNTLKSAENIMKSYLYLREMFNDSPVFNSVTSMSTIDEAEKKVITVDDDANLIMIKNIDDSNASIYYNGGEFVLLPFESFEFPVSKDITIEAKGRLSMVQTKYN